jgi:beta-mannosidase
VTPERAEPSASDSTADFVIGTWSLAWTAPGAAGDPQALEALAPRWLPVAGPVGTVAAVLRAADPAALVGAGVPERLDSVDWWFRCRFTDGAAAAARSTLFLDGLATLADGWLNGAPLLHSENMFVAHTIDVTGRIAADNELVLVFRSLDAALAARRPRPRWRAPMVEHQQLRWFRTTLLGRTPGWSPPVPAIGPWRPVRLRHDRGPAVSQLSVHAHLDGDPSGGAAFGVGRVEVSLQVHAADGLTTPPPLRAVVTDDAGGSWEVPLLPTSAGGGPGGLSLSGVVAIPAPRLWWPHTHGTPSLYQVRVVTGADAGGAQAVLAQRQVGFRSVELASADGDFDLSLNGVRVFCRGACWTPPDVATLAGTPDAYQRALEAVRDAGMNMVRVCGPMVYESDGFYDLCDRLGVMVWQDFMFANMDYPEEHTFVASVETEVRQHLARWTGRPSLTVLCGDSEGEQQAAMWGAAATDWERPLFRKVLPRLAAEVCPDVPYWPSSASGGAFPHQASAGTTSYYGVGAYLRPLDDARRSEVRFASECLGFANVPEEATLATLASTPGGPVRAHTPAWKAGVPRDLGAGWDFDDVRDHYVGRLFGVDPVELRATDPDRHLALGRVASGEAMAAAFAEWRRARSSCRGALVWFLRDLVVGAGWGVLDVHGRPKAAYHYLRRALQPLAIFFTDEGLNGAAIHVVNDGPAPWNGEVRLRLYRDGEVPVGSGDVPLSLPGHGAVELSASALLGGFVDTTYAYRFGPPGHDLAVARLTTPSGGFVGEAFHFPVGRPAVREADLGLTAQVTRLDEARFAVDLTTRRFAYAVAVTVADFESDDNYFHVAPGADRRIVLTRTGSAAAPRGTLLPTNARAATRIVPPT